MRYRPYFLLQFSRPDSRGIKFSNSSVTFDVLPGIQDMKTLILTSLALALNVGTFINAEMAFALMAAAGVLVIALHDYTRDRRNIAQAA